MMCLYCGRTEKLNNGVCSTCEERFRKKPPLGIEPHKVWIENRITDIWKAIERYISTNTKIPIEWIEEYNKLVDHL